MSYRRTSFDVQRFVEGHLVTMERPTSGKKGAELVCECFECGRLKLYVSLTTGLWVCYYCRDAGGSKGMGTLVDLVAELESVSTADARRMIWTETIAPISRTVEDLRFDDEEETEAEIEVARPPMALPSEFIPIYDPARDVYSVPSYLKKRGIKLKTARLYELGYCTDGLYADRLIFPIYVFGELKSFVGRAMQKWMKIKYRHPDNDEKSSLLYGVDQVIGFTEVVVVEGPTDVLAMIQRGIPTVGLLGKAATIGQANLLRRMGVRKVTVMLDATAPEATHQTARLFGERLEAHVAYLPGDVDPDEATNAQIQETLASARPPRLSDRLRWTEKN